MKKTVYFLMICIAGVLFSCTEEEIPTDSQIQSKKNISFAELQQKLNVSSKISVPNKMGKGIEDFEIDTVDIVQITTETVTTYSMKVTPVTGDDGFLYSYFIYDKGENISQQIVRFDYSQGVHYTADNITIVYDSNDSGATTGKAIGCTTMLLVVAPCEYGNWHDDAACEADGWVMATITICNGGGGVGGEYNGPVVPPNDGLPGEGEQPGGGSGDNSSDFDYFLQDLSLEANDWLTDSENVFILNEILNYLNANNYYDNNAYSFALWAVDYLMENPGFKFTPLLNIKGELEDNPYLLLNIPCSQFSKWMEVIDYSIPQVVNNRINQLNQQNGNNEFYIQKIEDADGPIVNMDFFPVTITHFPNNPQTGQPFTPSEFFQIMRKNLDDYLEGGPASFGGYNTLEMNKWLTNNYLTSLMRFDIQINNWLTQDGTVICIEQHSQKWKFATMRSPQDGIHPVSGIREFGYYQDTNGNYVYYTRGVDRVKDGIEIWLGNILDMPDAFQGADQLWDAFQQNLANFVNNPVNGNGHATINTDYKSRPDIDQLTTVLMGNALMSSLDGFNPCN